uniref:Uncharacterized protein n=1 Tax=Oryza sativa subsp. japonica TaxID=39947 RepID=Q69S87_ORYSJ|nr:hypothetical protein [Oryza sativa Japonica Group]
MEATLEGGDVVLGVGGEAEARKRRWGFGRRQAGGEAPAAVRPRVFLRTCPPGFK